MIISFAALLFVASAAPTATPQCSFATLSTADQKQYRSRYQRRVRNKGKAAAEEWVRTSVCPDARAAIRARHAAPPIGRDGRPCKKTRTEMRPITSGGSMTMIPKQICIG